MATRRSVEFQKEISRLLDAFETGTTLPSEKIRIADILRYNTTDNRCVVRAKEDEPVFVLRAKDPLAAATVEWWSLNAARKHEQSKLLDAVHVVSAMGEWYEAYKDQQESCSHESAGPEDTTCPSCDAKLECPHELLKRDGTCNKCGEKVDFHTA